MADHDSSHPITAPVKVSEGQLAALVSAGGRVWDDANHADYCDCDSWPENCVNGHFVGEWTSGALEYGIPAVIGLWESMRAQADANELAALRERVAELEALTPAAIQTCRICGAGYDLGQPCSTCAFKALMAAATADRQGDDHPEAPRG